jgi:aryl-alcohol dehydrogenase-like predicted oxidoreductase
MDYRRLGRTGLLVSEMCLGTNTMGGGDLPGWKALGGLDQAASNAVIRAAVDAGINFLDTADVYAAGQSEQRVGQAIRDLGLARQDIVIATKTGGRMGPGANRIGSSRGYLFHAVDASLQRLQTDYIDLWMVHFFDPATPLEETLRALDDIARSGRVRYIGCSNYAAWQLMKALSVSERQNLLRFEAVEAQWSIATRDIERELVPLVQDQQVGLMIWGPLVGGLLSGKFTRDGKDGQSGRMAGRMPDVLDRNRVFDIIDAMRPIADGHGVSVAQVAIAWVLHQKGVSSVLAGATRPEQVTENAKAAALKLSAAELEALDKASALIQDYGSWLARTTPADRKRYV